LRREHSQQPADKASQTDPAQWLPGVGGFESEYVELNQQGRHVCFVFFLPGMAARPAGKQFLIDGEWRTIDISVQGPAYIITNPDAVQEVNIQTAELQRGIRPRGGD